MSVHSCVLHEFPRPDREYYAAAPAQWDTPMVSRPRRPAPSRARRSPRRSPLPLLLLLGLTLFAGGFLLGRAEAAGNRAAQAAAGAGAGSGEPVRVLTVPGAVISSREDTPASGGEGGAASPDDWNLILVNGDHPLPEGFQIPELQGQQHPPAQGLLLIPQAVQRNAPALKTLGSHRSFSSCGAVL